MPEGVQTTTVEVGQEKKEKVVCDVQSIRITKMKVIHRSLVGEEW